jgi:hypothetical protein
MIFQLFVLSSNCIVWRQGEYLHSLDIRSVKNLRGETSVCSDYSSSLLARDRLEPIAYIQSQGEKPGSEK